MWQSIASADTSRECWRTIEEIEHGLDRYLASGDAALDDVTGGYAGAALFYAYLHAASANTGAADRALEALERSTSALAERQLLPALYSGFLGVGWVVTHLTRDLFEGDPNLAEEIDDALRQLLTNVEDKLTYELVYGLVGYGTYLVERLPDPGAAALLGRVLDLLEESRDPSGVWHSDPGWMSPWQREQMPRGCYNLGVAHGIPGVIGFLAAANREGIGDPRLARFADDAVRWTLARKSNGGSSIFPAFIPVGGDPYPTRTAWCYGDLGVAAMLLSAAQSFGRDDWSREALAIARIAARRSREDTLVKDAGLCHGSTGIAHLFNRMAQASGDDELRDAAERWYRVALDMRRPGEGLAGLLSWVDVMENGKFVGGEWKTEPGFLSGVAGVGLALLAAVTDFEPLWDRVLLVGIPPIFSESKGAAA
jgi:lantibiotic modifying enzyme